jgi:hypothetical protein
MGRHRMKGSQARPRPEGPPLAPPRRNQLHTKKEFGSASGCLGEICSKALRVASNISECFGPIYSEVFRTAAKFRVASGRITPKFFRRDLNCSIYFGPYNSDVFRSPANFRVGPDRCAAKHSAWLRTFRKASGRFTPNSSARQRGVSESFGPDISEVPRTTAKCSDQLFPNLRERHRSVSEV